MPLDRTQPGKYFDATDTHLRRIGAWRGLASYETGGESAPPSLFGLSTIVCARFDHAVSPTVASNPRRVVWDPATQKVSWGGNSGLFETAAGSNLSTFVSQFEVIGY